MMIQAAARFDREGGSVTEGQMDGEGVIGRRPELECVAAMQAAGAWSNKDASNSAARVQGSARLEGRSPPCVEDLALST